MLDGSRIAVVVPAYCEERLVAETLRRVPAFVDRVIVVDDASPDRTSEEAASVDDARITIVRHRCNQGVGAALATGYQTALAADADVIAVMAGDGQMDPVDLLEVVAPVVKGEADYVKGNRFVHERVKDMPSHRRLAGRMLAKLTCIASGLDVDDTQCGYTALSARAARQLPWDELWPRFGYPNDLLLMLAERKFVVAEVPVRPVYATEASGVRPWHAVTVAGVIVRRAVRQRFERGQTFSVGGGDRIPAVRQE